MNGTHSRHGPHTAKLLLGTLKPKWYLCFEVPNFKKARYFYLAALEPLWYKVAMMNEKGKVVGIDARLYRANFWLVYPDVGSTEERTEDEKASKYSQPLHIAFSASNRTQVREFYEAVM